MHRTKDRKGRYRSGTRPFRPKSVARPEVKDGTELKHHETSRQLLREFQVESSGRKSGAVCRRLSEVAKRRWAARKKAGESTL